MKEQECEVNKYCAKLESSTQPRQSFQSRHCRASQGGPHQALTKILCIRPEICSWLSAKTTAVRRDLMIISRGRPLSEHGCRVSNGGPRMTCEGQALILLGTALPAALTSSGLSASKVVDLSCWAVDFSSNDSIATAAKEMEQMANIECLEIYVKLSKLINLSSLVAIRTFNSSKRSLHRTSSSAKSQKWFAAFASRCANWLGEDWSTASSFVRISDASCRDAICRLPLGTVCFTISAR